MRYSDYTVHTASKGTRGVGLVEAIAIIAVVSIVLLIASPPLRKGIVKPFCMTKVILTRGADEETLLFLNAGLIGYIRNQDDSYTCCDQLGQCLPYGAGFIYTIK